MSAVSFWRKKRTRTVIAIVLLPCISVFVLTRSFVLSPILAISLQSKIGTDIEVRGTHWDWGNNVVVDEIILRAHEIGGLAANVISFEDVAITFDSSPITLSAKINEIDVHALRVRIAESAQQAGVFNFSFLLPSKDLASEQGAKELPKSSGSSVPSLQKNISLIPKLSLNNVIVETGVMDGVDWTLDSSKTFEVANAVYGEEQSTLQLIDTDDSMRINLSVDAEPIGFLAEIDDIQLDNSLLQLLPRTARTWCKEVKLQGEVNKFKVSWDANQAVQLSAGVQDVAFRLPEEHGIPWASYTDGVVEYIHGDALLDVKHGRIVYDGSAVYLNDIQGILVPPLQDNQEGLDFSADIKISDYQSVGDKKGQEWMDSLLLTSPFEASFTINNFVQGKSSETIIPVAAAQILNIFQLEDWKMNAKVTVERVGQAGDVAVAGDLIISGASGMYEKFPYPLQDIQSQITFDQNVLEIVYLNALGSEGAEVHISGDVQATSDYLVVDLNLYANDAPLDKKLHDALSKPIANVMDRLIDHEAFEKISKSLDGSVGNDFELGGSIDLALDIQHDNRIDSGVELSGEIKFENIGILHKEFPFPVVLKEGTVSLDPKGLYIPESNSIRFKGRELGVGGITGSIHFLENGTAMPDLKIELLNEYISSALITAVSISAGDSHELAAGVLGGLGLQSKLNATGTVKGNTDGSISTNFTVEFQNGTATPNKKLATAIHATGPFWPEGFEFTDINAKIQIENGVVAMDAVTCKCKDGFLTATMKIDKGEFELNIRGESLPISSRFVDVLPNSVSEKLSSAWRWLQPAGLMDAEINMAVKGESSMLNLNIVPKSLDVSALDRVATLDLSKGSIIVDGTDVFFNNMEFQLHEGDTQQGVLRIGGEVNGAREEFGYLLDATWKDASVDSPLTRAITGIVGGKSGVDFYDSIQPAGMVSATLSARGNQEDVFYNIEIIPETLSATFHGRKAQATFDVQQKSLDNIIRFNNEGIYFDYLFGKLGEGDFSVEGKIKSGERVDGNFDLTWSGPTGDESLFALLPKVVGDTLVAIELNEGQSTLPSGRVSFEGESWDKLAITFVGDISIDEASIEVGIPLKKIKGGVHILGKYSEEKLDALELSLEFNELSTLGRVVTNVEGGLEYVPEKKQLVFKQMRGESSTGGVTVGGWIGLDDKKEYEIEVLLAGIELSTVEGEEVVASLAGDLVGWFSIAGVRGATDSRRGVGRVQVEKGHLEIDPLSLKTMRVLQLAWPSAASIEGAEIDFYIKGDQFILEEIVMLSNARDISDLSLKGEGTVDFGTFQINARLHPRAGLPIIRDIVGALNDQLYSIDVTGELLDPKVSIVLLPFFSPQ